MKLRDYQNEAIQGVIKSWSRGTGRVLISLATGLGKTVVMAALPLFIKPKPDDVMVVVVNRDELVDQTVAKLKATHPAGKVGIEKAESRAPAASHFVVASVQTLRSKRLEEFFARFHGRIGIVLIDEAHHATAQSYRDIVQRFFEIRADGLLVGVTATPQRSDGTGLGCVFDEVVYHRDMVWAIENGYLVDIRCFKVQTNVSLDDVERRAGDFASDQLEEKIDVSSRNDLVVSAYLQHTPGKKAIAFCPTVKHAEHLCAAFLARGVTSAWASGSSSKAKRQETVAAFRRGETSVLVNCGLYLEGFDVPDVEVIIGCRPTQSSALYIQMTGRGMRPLDDVARKLGPGTTVTERRDAIARSAKPFVTILDIVDQSRHHSIITLPTLWGLPPKLDLAGGDVVKAVKVFKELSDKDPVAARAITAIKDVSTAIEHVNIYAVPQRPPEIIAISGMAWRQIAERWYRLPLPPTYEALMPDGTKIKNFARRYRAKVSEAKQKGAYPFHDFAREQIGFDQTTYLEIEELIDIRPTANEGFEVYLERDGKSRKLGSVDSLHEAFTRGERWIENNRSDLSSALSSKAAWRDVPPTPNQIKTLNKTFGVPLHLIPDKSGDANTLIDKLRDEKREKSPAA